MHNEYSESIDLLIYLLNYSVSDDDLRKLASLIMPHQDDGLSKIELIDGIVATQKWTQIIDILKINDFRVCSECGALMHQGYCCDMGYKYYCSDECLHHDFTTKEWIDECENEPQSYWTDWFEHYGLISEKQRYSTSV